MDAWLSLQLGLRLHLLSERADVLETGWKEKRLCCVGFVVSVGLDLKT